MTFCGTLKFRRNICLQLFKQERDYVFIGCAKYLYGRFAHSAALGAITLMNHYCVHEISQPRKQLSEILLMLWLKKDKLRAFNNMLCINPRLILNHLTKHLAASKYYLNASYNDNQFTYLCIKSL